jgi:hypothetical protein
MIPTGPLTTRVHIQLINNNNNNGVTNNSNNNNNSKTKNKGKSKDNYIRHTITLHSFRRFFKTQVSFEAKEADLSEFLLGHISTLNQRYFKLTPADVAKTYLNSVMEHLTFCDMASVEKAKEELTQQLIEEREVKDRELLELKKRMNEYEQSFARFRDIQ